MPNLSELSKTEKPAAPRVVLAEPSWFAGNWQQRPTSNVAIGLRLLSIQTKTVIFHASVDYASKNAINGQEFEIYQTALVYLTVARAMCDPNNEQKGHPLFRMPDDEVFMAYTEQGALRMFEEFQILEVERTFTRPMANQQEQSDLALAIQSGQFDGLTKSDRCTALRHMKYLLDML